MKACLLLLATTIIPALVSAAAVRKRDPSVTCGYTQYSSDQVATCVRNGEEGDGGSSNYPHRYKDYEGFQFGSWCSDDEYYEYPLTADGYQGGRPGADRCVYGAQSGAFCGAITHTGMYFPPLPRGGVGKKKGIKTTALEDGDADEWFDWWYRGFG